MPHTVTFSDNHWKLITKITGLPPGARGNQVWVRDLVYAETIKQSHNNGHSGKEASIPVEPRAANPRPATAPVNPRPVATTDFFGSNVPHFTDTSNRFGPWPLRPEVEAFAKYINLPIALLKPDHSRDDDEEYKHIEEKKFWIRCGFRFEGMSDPQTAADHVVGDIIRNRPISELPEKAVAAMNAMRGKFRAWCKEQK